MAGKTIQVNLQFNANIAQAKRQISELQSQLNTAIGAGANNPLNITPQIQQAQQSAMQLKIALQNATNVNTGKLNLNKFQAQLKQSGLTVKDLASSLASLGPEGTKAFGQFATAIASADTSLISLSGGMKKLTETFVNTARWQLTSSIIHEIMSTISGTIGYVKDLDTSLSNIRIVTGKSEASMAKFAKAANESAKALSTSTNEYAKASLIYYQQGLNDKQVKERADITIKMANVSRQSAQDVSDQMTAIWNNFDDGTRSLESYSDAMVKLGAETASSSDEIAIGMEKFAAISNAVGLSFDNAAAALATVTAKTRQSAEVVGTAFKTLFARIEQLQLGETLEDGTDLGKYSEALATIGVNIKDANGELKDMDTILDQTGQRWQTLSRDQQVALAQSVAGIRQYQQFIALMENYDFYQENIERAKNSLGALEKQNEIYASNVEAAEKRMQAAGEKVKSTLLSPDDLKPLYEFGEKGLEIIDKLLKSFGGLPTIVLGLAAALTKTYQPQIATFFSEIGIQAEKVGKTMLHLPTVFKNFTDGKGFTAVPASSYQSDIMEIYANMNADADFEQSNALLKKHNELQRELIQNQNKMSPQQQQLIDWQLKQNEARIEEIRLLEEELKKQEELNDAKRGELLENNAGSIDKINTLGSNARAIGSAKQYGKTALNEVNAAREIEKKGNLGSWSQEDRANFSNEIKGQLNSAYSTLEGGFTDQTALDSINAQIQDIIQSLDTFVNKGIGLEEITAKMEKLNNATENEAISFQNLSNNTLQGMKDEIEKNLGTNRQTAKGLNMINPNASTEEVVEGVNSIKLQDLSSHTDDNSMEQIKSIKKLTQERKKLSQQYDVERAKLDQLNKAGKGNTKEANTTRNTVRNLTRQINSTNKSIEAQAGALKANSKNLKNENKAVVEKVKTADENIKQLDELNEGEEQFGQNQAKAAQSTNNNNKVLDKQGELINNYKQNLSDFGTRVSVGLSAMSQLAMGMSMLTSSAEQLGAMFHKTFDFGDLISNMSSLLMSIVMIIPAISQTSKALAESNVVKGISIALSKLKKKADKEEGEQVQKTAEDTEKASLKERVAAFLKAVFNIGEQASAGPAGWVSAAISAALFAAITGAAIASGISGARQAKAEKVNADLDTGLETLSTIKENQDLSSSVVDLSDEYKELKASGESVSDIFDQMRDKIPELIESYKKLSNTIAGGLDTSELELAYENFKATGDITVWDQAQKEIDDKIKEQQAITANTAVTNAKLALDYAMEESSVDTDTSLKGQNGTNSFDFTNDKDTINKALNSLSDEANKLWEDAWDDDDFNIDLNNTNDIISKYELMQQLLSQMEKDGNTNTKIYEQMSTAVNDLSDAYGKLTEATAAQQELLRENLLNTEKENEDMQNFAEEIKNSANYAEKREEIIKKLVDSEYGFTKESAEYYLAQSKLFGQLERTEKAFVEGSKNTQLLMQNDSSGKLLNDIKDWYSQLSQTDQAIALSINYDLVFNKEDVEKQLREAISQANITTAIENAKKLDSNITDTQVKTYAKTLEGLTDAYDGNTEAATQAAAVNIKLQKGLESVGKVWKENVEIIREGKNGTFEYAEAVGKLKTELEKTFGVELSNSFIENEKNLDNLDRVLSGDLTKLGELQKAAALDYAANISLAVTDDHTTEEVNEWRNQLQEMVKEFDTSLTFGKNATIDPKYYQTLQDMLDSGAMTEEQLQKMFNAAGLTISYDYKWIDGPETRHAYYEVDKDGNKTDVKKYEEVETTKIRVPILRDKDGNTSNVKVTKASDKSTINSSAITKASGADSKKDKTLDDEIERYHKIKKQIESTTKEMDRLSKAKDKAFGKNRLSIIDQEIAKNKTLLEQNKQLAKEVEANLSKDAGIMKDYGAKFDEYGNITNYDTIFTTQFNKWKGNSSEAADKAYEKFKDALSRYEETINEYNEVQDAITDAIYKDLDLKLEKIDYKIEFEVDLDDRDLKYIEYMLDKIEDKAFKSAEAIKLMSQQTAINLSKIDIYTNGIKEILQASGASNQAIEAFLASGDISGLSNLTITADQLEKLEDFSEQLLDLNGELQEIAKTIFEEIITAFEEGNEEFEKATNKIEHLTSILENYRDIIDIVGKDALGIDAAFMKELNNSLIQTSKDALIVSKNNLDAQRENLAKAQEALAQAPEETKQYWEDTVQQIQETVMEAEEEFQDSWNQALQAAADAFENNVESIIDDLDKALGGIYGSLNEVKELFDQQKAVSELYLKDYQKMYETSKLMRTIGKSIDATDNVKAQRKLNDLMQQVAEYQKDGKKMSDYDLQYLQKKYDLLLAQQALEDARNAKDTVRLQRDSQGNYGYVYTANQDKIADAQQKVEDVQYALDNLNYDSLEQAQEDYLTHTEEWLQAKRELDREGIQDHEEYTRRLREIDDYYSQLVNADFEKLQAIVRNTGIQYSDTLLGKMYPDYDKFETFHIDTTKKIIDINDELIGNYRTFETTVDEVMVAASTSTEDFKNTVQEHMSEVRKESGDTATATEDMKKRIIKAFGEVIIGATTWESDYADIMKKVREQNELVYNSITKLIGHFGELETQAKKTKEMMDIVNNATTIKSDNSGNGTKGNGGKTTVDSKSTIAVVGGKTVNSKNFLLGSDGNYYFDEGLIDFNTYGPYIITKEKKASASDLKETSTKVAPGAVTNATISKAEKTFEVNMTAFHDTDFVNEKGIGVAHYLLTGIGRTQFSNKPEIKTINGTSTTCYKVTGVSDPIYKDLVGTYVSQGDIEDYGVTIPKYARGGLVPYTGPAWVDGTPSAPEAFLNPTQTSLIGQLAQVLELNVLTAERGLRVATPSVNGTSNGPQQNITIYADFPDATNHREIEEAFNTLVNRAAQYIGRN